MVNYYQDIPTGSSSCLIISYTNQLIMHGTTHSLHVHSNTQLYQLSVSLHNDTHTHTHSHTHTHTHIHTHTHTHYCYYVNTHSHSTHCLLKIIEIPKHSNQNNDHTQIHLNMYNQCNRGNPMHYILGISPTRQLIDQTLNIDTIQTPTTHWSQAF